MAPKELPVFARKLLDKIVRDNGFCDYSENIKSGSEIGDNFSSELFSITMVENKSDKRLDLVCKVAPSNKNHRKEFMSGMVFNREVLFYTKFMPIFAKFQEEKNVPESDRFTSFPKCYASIIDDEAEQFAIVLEDLRPSGFKLWSKAKPSPVENVRLAMRELGKYHGLSIAMKDQKPNEFSEFKQTKDIMKLFCESKPLQDLINNTFDRAIASLASDDHKAIICDIKSNLLLYLEDCLSEEASDRFGVLCHGDFWNNNMLFQFDEHGKAVDVRFLDWQVIRYVSPAIDLLYNIFTSTDKALRDKEYENMIECYYKSLYKTVKLLGSNPDDLFTFENLKDELKKCGCYALILAPCLLQISLAESSEISNFDEMFDKAADGERTIDLITGLSGKGQEEFDRRIREVIEDVINFGYYQRLN